MDDKVKCLVVVCFFVVHLEATYATYYIQGHGRACSVVCCILGLEYEINYDGCAMHIKVFPLLSPLEREGYLNFQFLGTVFQHYRSMLLVVWAYPFRCLTSSHHDIKVI